MEEDPKLTPEPEPLYLRFTLDGVYYAMKQNMLTKAEAEANLKKWFPEVEIIEPPDG